LSQEVQVYEEAKPTTPDERAPFLQYRFGSDGRSMDFSDPRGNDEAVSQFHDQHDIGYRPARIRDLRARQSQKQDSCAYAKHNAHSKRDAHPKRNIHPDVRGNPDAELDAYAVSDAESGTLIG
jgi:hypothetical protein